MLSSATTISTKASCHRLVVLVVTCLCLSSWIPPTHSWSASSLSRREMFQAATSAVATNGILLAGSVVAGAPMASWAAAAAAESSTTTTTTLKDELMLSRSKLQEIPALLQDQEWEKVRSILKTPPVNKLWNLGDSQNTVLKLAKETGDVELFELKDELAYQLQMCDQLTYDNVFVYFQPGSGKIKIKEPTESAQNAMKYLEEIILASGN